MYLIFKFIVRAIFTLFTINSRSENFKTNFLNHNSTMPLSMNYAETGEKNGLF